MKATQTVGEMGRTSKQPWFWQTNRDLGSGRAPWSSGYWIELSTLESEVEGSIPSPGEVELFVARAVTAQKLVDNRSQITNKSNPSHAIFGK